MQSVHVVSVTFTPIMVTLNYGVGIHMTGVESIIKLYQSKKWMTKKYVYERLTETQIAELCGTTQATINRWLEKHEIKKRR